MPWMSLLAIWGRGSWCWLPAKCKVTTIRINPDQFLCIHKSVDEVFKCMIVIPYLCLCISMVILGRKHGHDFKAATVSCIKRSKSWKNCYSFFTTCISLTRKLRSWFLSQITIYFHIDIYFNLSMITSHEDFSAFIRQML